jgi:hypothetical protein
MNTLVVGGLVHQFIVTFGLGGVVTTLQLGSLFSVADEDAAMSLSGRDEKMTVENERVMTVENERVMTVPGRTVFSVPERRIAGED